MGDRILFTAWEYDSTFHTLKGRVEIPPIVTSSGEQIYRVPRCATLVAPPEISADERKRPVWLERTQSWIVVSDHRGETWVDDFGRQHLVQRLGDPSLWGWRPLQDSH